MNKPLTLLAAFVLTCSMATSQTRLDTVIYSRNAYDACTRPEAAWINFCNGLIQGYAETAVIGNVACIPSGTTRTTLVTIYTNRLPSTEAYRRDDPAIYAAMEIFRVVYACR